MYILFTNARICHNCIQINVTSAIYIFSPLYKIAVLETNKPKTTVLFMLKQQVFYLLNNYRKHYGLHSFYTVTCYILRNQYLRGFES